MENEFKEFPKITRFYEQDVCITEKIDGTNGLVWISEDLSIVRAGSRSRWISTTEDNYGFARFVDENAEELKKLGAGYHYGEWWGQGIQRKYGMDRKVFSLFNVNKWSDETLRPSCCDVVPVLYNGEVTAEIIDQFSRPLPESIAAKKYGVSFTNTEGAMMYFTKGGVYFKCPTKKMPKGISDNGK